MEAIVAILAHAFDVEASDTSVRADPQRDLDARHVVLVVEHLEQALIAVARDRVDREAPDPREP